MGILFIGDIIGRPGRKALKKYLPQLKSKYSPTLIIANGENAAGGAGITERICRELLSEVNVLTSGNHVWDKREVLSFIGREPRLLRPANYPPINPGRGTYIFEDGDGRKVGILNLQGRVFMEPIDCPFRVADKEVEKLRAVTPVIIVDFHAEATSEKQALGWYLDGKVSAVIGTHTHVPTADERILPRGTAYITDMGMAGGLDSVIGIRREPALQRFLTGRSQRFEPEADGSMLSAMFIEVDCQTGKAIRIQKEIIKEEEGEE
ncbi:MAG: TIGR00282 family metallophosphoesterase [Candidatus Aminicenantes bacterium]|nr:TIGR00282 family metallophosphoesterase [Candidatus Aminicenantes bacterium]